MRDSDGDLVARLVAVMIPTPVRLATDRAALQELYADLPIRFPAVYEKLISAYRWPEETEAGPLELLANPPGKSSFEGLSNSIRYDRHLTSALLPASFVPFARPVGGDWDPICFNGSVASGKHDRQIVRIDHESILCNDRIKIEAVLASSFRSLVEGFVAAR